jgi:hypothetical protein
MIQNLLQHVGEPAAGPQRGFASPGHHAANGHAPRRDAFSDVLTETRRPSAGREKGSPPPAPTDRPDANRPSADDTSRKAKPDLDEVRVDDAGQESTDPPNAAEDRSGPGRPTDDLAHEPAVDDPTTRSEVDPDAVTPQGLDASAAFNLAGQPGGAVPTAEPVAAVPPAAASHGQGQAAYVTHLTAVSPTPEALPVAVLNPTAGQNPAATSGTRNTGEALPPGAVAAVGDAAAAGAGQAAADDAGQQSQSFGDRPSQPMPQAAGTASNTPAGATAFASASSAVSEAADPGVLGARPTAADGSTRPAGNTPPAPLVSTPVATGTAESDAPNAARIARGLQSALNQRGGGVTLRLTPADLGTIRIRLDISAGRVAAEFQPTTQAGQQLLNGQLAQLRASLESQGLTVDRLGVQTVASSSNSNAPQNHAGFNQSGQDPTAQQQTASDGRSRGQYQSNDPANEPEPDAAQASPDTFSDALNLQSDPTGLTATPGA